MQIIYAAPFVLLSLVCFAVFMAIPLLRRFAFRALVVPVAFGFCAILGWILFALSLVYLKPNLAPNTPFPLVVAGVIFWVLPGILGAWLTALAVKKVEDILLKMPGAWYLAVRVVVSLIFFALASLIGLGLIGDWLGPNSLTTELALSALSGATVGLVAYFAARTVQRRASSHVQKTV